MRLVRPLAERATLVRAPKTGGVRWLTILDGPTADAYAAAVARVVPGVEAALGDEVRAHRVAAVGPAPPFLRLEPWRPARARFLMAARRLATSAGALLVADVRRCYPTIGAPVVGEALARVGCAPSDVAAVLALLERLARIGVPGLPVGPEPSAVLANAVLAAGDEALRAPGLRHLRWVDDFWAFAPDRARAEEARANLVASLAALGLSLGAEKTQLVDHPQGIAAVVTRGSVSAAGPRYHRRSDAHPVPRVTGPHPVVPAEGGVDPGRRSARAAGGLG